MGSKTVAKQAVREGKPVRKATFRVVKRGVYAPVNKRAVKFTRAIGGRINAKITKAELLQVSNNGAEVCVYASDGTLKSVNF